MIKAQLNGDRIDLFWVVDNQILQTDCVWLKDINGFELQRAAPEMLEALEGLVDADFVDGIPPWATISQLTGKFSCEYCGRVVEEATGWAIEHSESCPVGMAFASIAKAKGES